MNAGVVSFQEIFDADALQAVIDEADAAGMEANEANVPDRSKKYACKAIFMKLAYAP